MKTRRTILTSTALFALAVGLSAQEQPPQHQHAPGQDPHNQQPGGRPPQPPSIRQLQTGSPNDWFDRTKLFMGEFLDQERVSGKFSFENKTGKTISFKNLQGSCQCAQATIKIGERVYRLTRKPVANSLHRIETKNGKPVKKRVTHINIEPGDAGTVEVEMEMGGMQGLKDASLAISTSDPNMKQVTLAWQARGVKLFSITPNDVFLNNMKWGDTRKFTFIVESEINPDFKLLDHAELPSYVKVTKELIERPNGKKAWKVDGTFGPNADPKSGGASIKFKTNWKDKEVQLNVIATITGPITINPGTFVSFGKIRKGKGAERKITITPNGDFTLAVEKIEFENVTLDKKYISATSAQVGKDLVVTVTIAPEAEGAFLVRGKMVLYLNHPAIKTKKFNFNGILR